MLDITYKRHFIPLKTQKDDISQAKAQPELILLPAGSWRTGKDRTLQERNASQLPLYKGKGCNCVIPLQLLLIIAGVHATQALLDNLSPEELASVLNPPLNMQEWTNTTYLSQTPEK